MISYPQEILCPEKNPSNTSAAQASWGRAIATNGHSPLRSSAGERSYRLKSAAIDVNFAASIGVSEGENARA